MFYIVVLTSFSNNEEAVKMTYVLFSNFIVFTKSIGLTDCAIIPLSCACLFMVSSVFMFLCSNLLY